MSSQWNTALTGFMQSLGFADFKASAADLPCVNNIDIANGRYMLDIEELGDARGIVLALFQKVPVHELYEKARQLLCACRYDQFLPAVVQVGLRGNDTLVLMVRVEQAWGESMAQAFDLMYKLYEDLDT